MFVLFDLDDTLLMTGEREDRFFGEAFRDVLGRELPTTDWEVLGASTDHGILRALGVGDAAIERVADAHEARWRKALAASPPKPRQGATDALLRVEGLGMPTGVATGGFARVARRKLASLGVSAPPLLATSESGSTRTALLRHAMRELGPEGVYVGDGPWDR
ncbi:MAG: HAD family hydrolase, partial [Myxococcota bacterium]